MFLDIALWFLFGSSFVGMSFVIGKKMPMMMALPEEDLVSKETFVEFLKRKKATLPLVFEKIKIKFFKGFNKILLGSKRISLGVHNLIHSWTEALNKKLHHSHIKLSQGDQGAQTGQLDNHTGIVNDKTVGHD